MKHSGKYCDADYYLRQIQTSFDLRWYAMTRINVRSKIVFYNMSFVTIMTHKRQRDFTLLTLARTRISHKRLAYNAHVQ